MREVLQGQDIIMTRVVKIEASEAFLTELYHRIVDLENHWALRVPYPDEFIDLQKRVEKLEEKLQGL